MLSRSLLPQACELCRLSPTARSGLKLLHSRSANRAAVLSNQHLYFARAGPSSASSRHSISNTPKWSDESIAAAREKYEAKYAERLKQKAQEYVAPRLYHVHNKSVLLTDDRWIIRCRQGFKDIEQLKKETLEKARLTNRAKDILSKPKSKKPSNAKLAAEQASQQETNASATPAKESSNVQTGTAASSQTSAKVSGSSKSPIKVKRRVDQYYNMYRN